MPLGLKRYHHEADDHFITFSCHRREPYLNTQSSRDIFLDSFDELASVTISKFSATSSCLSIPTSSSANPPRSPLSKALQSLKLSVSKRLTQRPFWQTRYYDFNVFTHNKRVEKLKYMHRNPVTRGLVEKPEDWRWSSYRHYRYNEPTPVLITQL